MQVWGLSDTSGSCGGKTHTFILILNLRVTLLQPNKSCIFFILSFHYYHCYYYQRKDAYLAMGVVVAKQTKRKLFNMTAFWLNQGRLWVFLHQQGKKK